MIRLALMLLFPLASIANPGEYRPSTLRIVNASGDRGVVGKGTADFFATMPLYTVIGEYTGDVRNITPSRLQYISEYAVQVKQPALAKEYKREIKVKEGTIFYWIPVQETDIADFAKELKNGQKFVIFLGVAGKTVDRETVLFLMDFSSDKADVDALQKALTQPRTR